MRLFTPILAVAIWVFAATTGGASTPVSDDDVRGRANTLLAQMTPQEKVGQMSQFFYLPQSAPLAKALDDAIASGGVGALLFVTDPAQTNRLQKIAVEKSRLKIPLLFGLDVIHGLRTIFPVPLGLAASWDPEMVSKVQGIAASEARAVGIHWTFAPNVDIARDARWGRLVEGSGEDPYLGSVMAAAQVLGFQGPRLGSEGRVIAGPKHLAGYGAAVGGRDYDEVNLSDNELWNVYLPPFKAAVDAGAGNIMSAYMPLNGVPATGNHWLLTTVLREKWGFKGFVVSDSGAVISLSTHGLTANDEDAAVRALKAGINMEMAPPGKPTAAVQALLAALSAGNITEQDLNDAVRPVLEAKIRMGLLDNPYVDEQKARVVLDAPEHRTTARVAAERSAVLLRNENSLLPLDRNKIKSVAVIGPLANAEVDTLGPWVFQPNRPSGVTMLAGLRNKLGKSVRVDYAQGVQMPPRLYPSPTAAAEGKTVPTAPTDDTAGISSAVELARRADVSVLVLGEAQDMIGERASRSTLDLPGRQQQLLDAIAAIGKPVVLLLMSARPLDLKGTQVPAILDIWYPGSEAGNAVANLLFGEATPGGKLPFTWIRNAAQAPMFYSHLVSHRPADVGKRYWNESNDPTYPFGYGLSYTTFKYSNLHIERSRYAPGEAVVVTAELKNTGARAGDEVAQLYIHQRTGTSARPIHELKGFQRVRLAPGKSRTLIFKLTSQDLSYWSAATGDWLNDESAFDVWVGGDSVAEMAGSFEVKQASH
jgi:beta-glucosidase